MNLNQLLSGLATVVKGKKNNNRANKLNRFKQTIRQPLTQKMQGFGPGRISINCTQQISQQPFTSLVSFKLRDVLVMTNEFLTYSARFEVYKLEMLGITIMPTQAHNQSMNTSLYVLNRWVDSTLIDSDTMPEADGVKIVPSNTVKPVTLTFKMMNFQSANGFNYSSWHDVNDVTCESLTYFYCPDSNVNWSVRFDIRVAFAQPVPLTMPSNNNKLKATVYEKGEAKTIYIDKLGKHEGHDEVKELDN
jgi:hypothetical protein